MPAPVLTDGTLARTADRSSVTAFLPGQLFESLAQSISYWSAGNGDDTMVTLWNPADEAQDFVFVIFYSGGKYSYPVHLTARATRMFNISEIINSQITDKDGNVIPVGVHEGSAMVMGSRGPNENILVAMEVGTYSAQKATCPWFCHNCFGETDSSVDVNPFAVTVGGQTQLTMKVQFSSGYEGDYTATSTWGSSKTSVATVSTGLTKGMSAGSATVSATTPPLSSNPGQVCGDPPAQCPVTPFQRSSPGAIFQVTNVLPSNLALGGNGTLTIYGQGFQSLFSPTAQFGSGSGITTGTLTVLSDTEMTESYQVTCSAVLGSQDLQIGSSIDGGISGKTWPESIVLPAAPTPAIKLGGNTITGTQSVVVGQQIALSGSVSLPPCTSISSQQWSPSQSASVGTPVGGYSTTSSSGSVTALPPNTNSTYTFYWVYPTNGVTATFQYTMSGGGGSAGSPVSTATFNVTGAGSMTNTPYTEVTIDSLQPCGGGTASPAMVYGNITGTICKANAGGTWGIYFVPSGAPAETYSYVQLLNTDTITYTPTTGNIYTCTISQGVDSAYPYAGIIPGTNPPQALDAPGVPLPSQTYNTVNRSFNATMFLLWTSSVANSIPVPLGYQTWAFNGTAHCTSSCGTVSNWTPTTNGSPGPVGPFTASNGTQTSDGYSSLEYGYPLWGNVATQSCH